ncbi:MAG: hypothetical protein JWN70_4252 [Planctomycetaceae bacterium]|nr:hypothetical protein [Planctomycetaceae bacterium]
MLWNAGSGRHCDGVDQRRPRHDPIGPISPISPIRPVEIVGVMGLMKMPPTSIRNVIHFAVVIRDCGFLTEH